MICFLYEVGLKAEVERTLWEAVLPEVCESIQGRSGYKIGVLDRAYFLDGPIIGSRGVIQKEAAFEETCHSKYLRECVRNIFET